MKTLNGILPAIKRLMSLILFITSLLFYIEAFSEPAVFDVATLAEIDKNVVLVFQNSTGKPDADEILNEYVTSTTLKSSQAVVELRTHIDEFILSSFVDKNVFLKLDDECHLLLDHPVLGKNVCYIQNSTPFAEIRKSTPISKITVQLMLEQLSYYSQKLVSLIVEKETSQFHGHQYHSTESLLFQHLSHSFGDEHIGAPAGPGSEWKRYATLMTKTLMILSVIVDEDGGNFGVPSFAHNIFSAAPLVNFNLYTYKTIVRYLQNVSSVSLDNSNRKK